MRPARRDPGLQPERTWLAWRRTTLAYTVAAALAAKAALHSGLSVPALLTCTGCLGLWLVLISCSACRIRALAAPSPRRLTPRLATATAVCTVTLALCGMIVVA